DVVEQVIAIAPFGQLAQRAALPAAGDPDADGGRRSANARRHGADRADGVERRRGAGAAMNDGDRHRDAPILVPPDVPALRRIKNAAMLARNASFLYPALGFLMK